MGKLRSFLGLLAFVFGVVGATGGAVADAEVCPTGYQSNGIACMPIKFTVKYDAGSADAVGTVAEMTCEYDRVCTVKGNGYTWTGHTFQNWKCEGDCVKELWQSGDDIGGGTTVADAVLTLVAQWTANKTNVVLSATGDLVAGSNSALIEAEYGAELPVLTEVPAKLGYALTGFWDAESGGVQYYDVNGNGLKTWDKNLGKTTLYAQWTKCSSGYYCPGDNIVHTCAVHPEGKRVRSTGGYDEASDCYVNCTKTTISNGTATLVSSQSSFNGTEYPACSFVVVCNEGYHSSGTDTAPECSANTYSVEYVGGDGATGSMTGHSCVYGQDCEVQDNAFQKAGFIFLGWECTGGGSACDGDLISGASTVQNLTAENDVTVTLTAVWGQDGVCMPGYYYDGTQLVKCPANSFCSGEGTVVAGQQSCSIEVCPTAYPSSDAGAVSADECFAECTTSCVQPECPEHSIQCSFESVEYTGKMWNGSTECSVTGNLYCDVKGQSVVCGVNYFHNQDAESPVCLPCTSLSDGSFRMSGGGLFSEGGTACYKTCDYTCPLTDTGEPTTCPDNSINCEWIDPVLESLGYSTYPGETCVLRTASCSSTWECADGYTADYNAGVCVPNVYAVTLDANGGVLETNTIYLKYATGWFSDEGATSEILTAPIPTKENVTFGGYADENGVIQINAAGVLTNLRMFSDDSLTTTLTAQWVEARTDCRAGKYFDATTQSHTACPEGSYCPGEGLVAISETGCVETCPDGFTSDLGLATKEIDCYKVCSAGQYWDGNNCVDAESGFYGFKEETRVNYGTGAYGNTACPTGATGSDNGRNEQGDCFVACPDIEMPENAVAVVAKNAKEYFDGNVYPTCVYTVTCDENGGWTVVDGTQNTTNPQCEYTAECPEGFWCVDGKKNACPDDGDGNPNTVPTSPRASSKITDCYVIYSPYAGFQNGLASAKCNYNDVDTPNGYTTCNKDTVFNCNGGYYYNGGMLCEGVKPGYYSPAPVNPTQTVVDAASVVQTACPSGVYKSEELAASFTQCQAKCETSVVNSVSVTPVAEFVNGASADSYEACLFNVSCKDGYSVNGNGTTNPTCVANEYTISFNANGGTGNVDAVKCVFDSGNCTLPANTFERTGYSPDVKWCNQDNTKCYDANVVIAENISALGADVELYATWTPNVYKISLDKNSDVAVAGTPVEVYLKYATGWFEDAEATTKIDKLVSNPSNIGYEFVGFYTNKNAKDGVQVIDANGALLASALTFAAQDTTIYAGWTSTTITCPVTKYYDGIGGNPETDCVACVENNYCPGGTFAVDANVQGLNVCPDNGFAPAGSGAVADCYQIELNYVATNGSGTQTCYYDADKQTYYSDNCKDMKIEACNAGYWLVNQSDIDCAEVGNDFYSGDKELIRTECPDGGFTSIKTAGKVSECQLRVDTYQAQYATGTQICYYNPDSQKEGVYKYETNCHTPGITSCRGGYYDSGVYVDESNPDCVPVGVAYYSNSGDTQRHACPYNGTTKDDKTEAVSSCFLTGLEFPPADWTGVVVHGKGTRTCYYNQDTDAYTYDCDQVDMLMCDGGYYFDRTLSETACGGIKSCAVCSEVGYNYYSPAPLKPDELVADAQSRERVMCPVDSTTDGTHGTDGKTSYDVSQCFKENITCVVNNGLGVNKCYVADDGTYTEKCSECVATTCSAGYYLASDGNCTQCPAGSYCDPTIDDGNPQQCPTDYPMSDAGAVNSDYCYADCAVVENAVSVAGKNYQGTTLVDTCEITACQAGFYLNGDSCVECPEGYICNPSNPDGDKVSCADVTGGTHTMSDAGQSDAGYCYADCPAAENSINVTGREYWGDNVADTCQITACQAGFYLNNGACEKCPEGYICDPGNPNGDKVSCADATENKYTKSDEGISDVKYCYADCKPVGNAVSVVGRDYYDATLSTCKITACVDGFYQEGGACVVCQAGSVCNPDIPGGSATCESLTGGSHTMSDAETSDVAMCYTDCPVVENAQEMTGRDYYQSTDTCEVVACMPGFKESVNGGCVVCPAGEVCNPDIPGGSATCSTLTGGTHTMSDAGAKDISACYAECPKVEHAINVSGRDYWGDSADMCLVTACEAGYYLNGGICSLCPVGSYCNPNENDGKPVECPATHPSTNAGADEIADCFNVCQEYKIVNGTAKPMADQVLYPAECEFYGVSDNGNPCEIVDGVCIENACQSTHEMINGMCTPCNRENALTYLPEGNCRVELCVSGYHPNVDRCEEDIIDCEAPHAVVARQTWDSKLKSYGICMIEECEDGYHVASNACVVDVQDCVVENGVGLKEWNHSTDAWGECIATRCEPGYTMDPSLTNERTKQCGQCKNKFSVLGEIAASSYVSECEIASCMYQGEKYNLENNECHPICDINGYEDETGTMKWDSSRKKCIRTCKEGYTSW